jgi:hypothetical protein
MALHRSALAVASAVLSLVSSLAPATTFTVINTADSGAGSLRDAITSANTNPGLDTIAFAIPGTDASCVGSPKVCTIQPLSQLPDITDPVILNGYSQSGASANTLAVGDDAVLLIEIDATHLNPALRLAFPSSGSTIRGLVISHLAPAGIAVGSFGAGSDNNTISGNFIGTDPGGTATSGSGDAIDVNSSSGTIIGGTAPASRNILSGTSNCVYVIGTNSVIQGNYIGINKNGAVSLVGTVPQTGIQLDFSGSGNLIGGLTAAAANVIGAYAANAIALTGAISNNTVQGNLIGTNAMGTAKLGGGLTGIEIAVSGTGNVVGGTTAGSGNLISGGNGNGIVVNSSATDIVVQGNKIGTDITGANAIPNPAVGILVTGGGGGTIGGTTAGAGNIVAFNVAQGVFIAAGTGWAVLGNSIFANTGLGISFSGGAPTQNDDGDADTGPNNLQNYPVVTGVTIVNAGNVMVSGTLNSTADTTFHAEFFANAGCDVSGNGQGKAFIGFADVTTVGNDISFGPLGFSVPAHRHVISATATDPGNNTSEFSACSTQDSIFTDGYEDD